MLNFRKIFSVNVLLVACLCLLPAALRGQVDTGQVTGRIVDSTGSAIVGATVTLTNTASGAVLAQPTGTEGNFTFASVRVGTYTLTTEAPGFAKVTQNNISVNIQQSFVANLTLQPGTVASTIEVTAATAQMQTEEASVGNVVQEKAIQNLPLNGRNFTFLAQLSAGVTQSQQDTRGLAQNGGFSSNGTPPNQNNYLLDGVDNNSNLNDYLNGAYYVYLPSVDALSEFKVQTSNFSAEFGRAAGAVLNATTRSGSDRFHGSAFEFFRNDALNARNYFETTGKKGEFRLNQFGATLGGPIWRKKKLYFFGDYQGGRIVQASPITSTVPTNLERNSGYTNLSELLTQGGSNKDIVGRTWAIGQVFDPATTRFLNAGQVDPVTGMTATSSGYIREVFPGNIIPRSRIDQTAIGLLNAFPTPTSGSLFSNYFSSPNLTDSPNQGDARVDWIIGNRGSVFLRGSINRQHTFVPPPFTTVANGGAFATGTQTNDEKDDVLGWTFIISPTTVNEARVGYSRIGTSRYQAFYNDLTIPTQYGISGIPQFPNNGGLPTYNIAGLSQLGASPWEPTSETGTVLQVTENLTKVAGRHTFKGGGAYQRIGLSFFQPPYSRGNFTYNGVYTDIANITNSSAGSNSTLGSGGGNTGLAQMLLTPIPGTVPGAANYIGGTDKVQASNAANTEIARNYFAFYGEDVWKLTQKLTTTVGLRWEYVGHGTSDGNAQGNFVPAGAINGLNGPEYLLKTPYCNNSNNSLSPSFISLTAKDGIAITCSSLGPLVTTSLTNFAPRVGFAYQVATNIVIRAAFGTFYGASSNGDNLGTARNYPFYYTFTYNYPDVGHPLVFPDGSRGTVEAGLSALSFTPNIVNAAGLSLGATQYHLGTPYYQTYNLTVETQITPTSTFTIGYVGNQGRHIVGGPAINAVTQLLPPSANPQNYIQFPDFARGFGNFATTANQNYNSLQASIQRRVSNGLSYNANYTWSKCLTDARDGLNNNIGAYRANGVPSFGIKGDYGLCDYNVPSLAHLNGSYQLPFGHGQRFGSKVGGFTNQLIAGWTANAIVTLQSGQPFTVPCTITTAAGLGCYADVNKAVSLYGSQHNANQWMNPAAFYNPPVVTTIGQTDFSPLGGRGSQVSGPPFRRVDLSLLKAIPIHEDFRAEFRAEVFNITNSPQLGQPGFSGPGVIAAAGSLNFVSPANFGRITATRDGAYDQREFQFAAKIYW